MTAQEQALVEYLAGAGGAVFDADGRATSKIASAIGATAQRTTMMLATMERDGRVAREVEGKRTYLIILCGFGEEPPQDMCAGSGGGGSLEAHRPEPDKRDSDTAAPEHELVFQIQQLEARLKHVEADLVTEKDRRRQLALQMLTERERAERAERNCERMRQNLMRERDHVKRGQDTIRELISERERNDLDRMMREIPASR